LASGSYSPGWTVTSRSQKAPTRLAGLFKKIEINPVLKKIEVGKRPQNTKEKNGPVFYSWVRWGEIMSLDGNIGRGRVGYLILFSGRWVE
jgi:hypothetical protein